MSITKDPQQKKELFSNTAQKFMGTLGHPMFMNKDEAVGMIEALDPTIDVLTEQMREQGLMYSDDTILQFGSVLGEAFKLAMGGDWHYSDKQGRWVVLHVAPDGTRAEMNVFRKIENRIENGMEDSVLYFYQAMQKTLEGGVV